MCPTLCEPMDCSLPGSSVRGFSQARILEWVAISFSRGSSWPRDRTHVSCDSCITGGFFIYLRLFHYKLVVYFIRKLLICYHDVLKFLLLIFELYWWIFVDETNHTLLTKIGAYAWYVVHFIYWWILFVNVCLGKQTREKELPEIFPFCSFRVTVWSQVSLVQWNVLWSVLFLPSPLSA